MPDAEPFDQFLARTASAQIAPYLDILRASPAGSKLSAEAMVTEFQRMKEYIAQVYREVTPLKTLVDSGGHILDCIPFDQQTSVRAARSRGITVHAHLAPPPHFGPSTASAEGVEPHVKEASPCPPGSVLMRRVTLEDLCAFGTLENHFRKAEVPGVVEPQTPK